MEELTAWGGKGTNDDAEVYRGYDKSQEHKVKYDVVTVE